MTAQSDRLAILEMGEAKGVLKPEHVAELARLRQVAQITGKTAPGAAKTEATDKKDLQAAQDRSDAAASTLRLYNRVQPAIDRFDGGPLKGTLYDMVMPNQSGGFWDGVGSIVGAPVRALLPSQAKDDYQVLDAARNERIALRQMQQKGPQTDKDAKMYGKSDIAATNSTAVNHRIMDAGRQEAHLTQLRSLIESKWVAKYGSTAKASPNGMTFQQAVNFGQQHFLNAQAQRRQAPPSTRRANNGWSVTEVSN